MGPVRLRDVEAAQAEIVTLIKDMADRGEIQIAQSDEDDILI